MMNKEDMEKEIKDFSMEFVDTRYERGGEDIWHVFKTRMGDVAKKHVPQKMLKGKFDLPWINPAIKKLIRRKHKHRP